MSHMDEGALLTLADGELEGEPRREAELHLAGCEVCRAEMERLEAAASELSGALALLPPVPDEAGELRLRQIRRRAAATRTPSGWSAFPRAAVLVLGFAAAASAAIPGTPVNRWVRAAVEPEAPAAVVSEPVLVEARPTAPEDAEAGVSVLPERGSVQVELRGASPELRVRAQLSNDPRAGVVATGEAAGARFSTSPGRIQVDGVGGGELRIALPRNATSATVVVNGRRYLAKEGDHLRLSVAGEDSAGAEVSFRVLQ